jgi:hypothetical protein
VRKRPPPLPPLAAHPAAKCTNIKYIIPNKEFIIKMEGNTGEFSDISGSEIHEGRSVQSIR